MSDKIKEEITLRHRNNFVSNFDKQTEALRRSKVQPLCDIGAEIFGPGRRIDLECFVRIVGEVDFVEYLGGFVLDGLDLDLVGRVFPLPVSQGFL